MFTSTCEVRFSVGKDKNESKSHFSIHYKSRKIHLKCVPTLEKIDRKLKCPVPYRFFELVSHVARLTIVAGKVLVLNFKYRFWGNDSGICMVVWKHWQMVLFFFSGRHCCVRTFVLCSRPLLFHGGLWIEDTFLRVVWRIVLWLAINYFGGLRGYS